MPINDFNWAQMDNWINRFFCLSFYAVFLQKVKFLVFCDVSQFPMIAFWILFYAKDFGLLGIDLVDHLNVKFQSS